MIKKSLIEVAQMAGGSRLVSEGGQQRNRNPLIHGVSIDSRTIGRGELFVPIHGARVDGHDFIEQVKQQGAAASFWKKDRKPYPAGIDLILVDDTLRALQQLATAYRKQLQIKVVGVTGSNGKTTTKDLIHSVLSKQYSVYKTKGNMNTDIGMPLTLLRMEETTEVVVLEMGMRGLGEIELLSKLALPDIAVITNIGESHLETLKTRENIAKAKLEILSGLSPNGVFIYNGDEPLLQRNYNVTTIRYGIGQDNDLVLKDLAWNGRDGMTFGIEPGDSRFQVPLLGEHNVLNAMASIAVGRTLGMNDPSIAQGLSEAKISEMRIEVLQGRSGITLLNDCYNASPSSMKASIRLLEEMPDVGKKILILGDMLELGEQERQLHEEVGTSINPDKVDYVIATGSLGKWIILGALRRFPEERAIWMETKQEVLDWMESFAEPDCVALIKASRGMAMEEITQQLVAPV